MGGVIERTVPDAGAFLHPLLEVGAGVIHLRVALRVQAIEERLERRIVHRG